MAEYSRRVFCQLAAVSRAGTLEGDKGTLLSRSDVTWLLCAIPGVDL